MDTIERTLENALIASGDEDAAMSLELDGIVLDRNAIDYAKNAKLEEINAQILAMEGLPSNVENYREKMALLKKIKAIKKERFGTHYDADDMPIRKVS